MGFMAGSMRPNGMEESLFHGLSFHGRRFSGIALNENDRPLQRRHLLRLISIPNHVG
jgi:hypothetical protein